MAISKVTTSIKGSEILSVTTANLPGAAGGTNASITPVNGMLVYNSTLGMLQQRVYVDNTSSWQTVEDTEYNDDVIKTNIAMLGFKVAVNGSLAKYSLVDQVIDEYAHASDTSGIDASASTNEVLAGGAYTGVGGNYYGNASDGAVSTSGAVTHTVQNKVGSYDGDMLVKQYSSLTINAGHTMTVDQPCRGMFIYVQGNCTIAGTLSMTARGAFADPTGTASSDNNAVNANGLQLGLFTDSGSTSHTNTSASFNGCGTAARTAFGNQLSSFNSTVYTLVRQGASGAAQTATISSGAGNGSGVSGDNGTTGSTGQTGGGGAGNYMKEASGSGAGGAGAYGSCFSGGSGGGGAANASGTHIGGAGVNWGGAGGDVASGGYVVSGGTGNPGGAHSGASSSNGTGGLIILIVGGNLTINSGGSIQANGVAAPNTSSSWQLASGGSSGGGNILALCAGTYANNGTVQAIGGASSTATSANYTNRTGGAGGAGSVQTGGTLSDSIGDLTLQSTDSEAEVQPTKADLVTLIEDAGTGVGVINTDIKGFISRDSGTTFTEGTLVDEGNWGTNKRILAFHDLDISGQPADKTMCYKITTLNTSGVKNTKIHATSIGWR